MNKRIVVTGGSGRFGQILKKTKNKYKLFYPNKKQLDITNFEKIKSYLKNLDYFKKITRGNISKRLGIKV